MLFNRVCDDDFLQNELVWQSHPSSFSFETKYSLPMAPGERFEICCITEAFSPRVLGTSVAFSFHGKQKVIF